MRAKKLTLAQSLELIKAFAEIEKNLDGARVTRDGLCKLIYQTTGFTVTWNQVYRVAKESEYDVSRIVARDTSKHFGQVADLRDRIERLQAMNATLDEDIAECREKLAKMEDRIDWLDARLDEARIVN